MNTAQNPKQDTPKSLEEACKRGTEAVREFLAQRFSAALLKTDDPEEQNRLWALWAQITSNEGKRS